MAIPPIEGVSLLWIFLLPGISTRFLCKEYFIMTGTIKKEITNAVIADASWIAINGVRSKNNDSDSKRVKFCKTL
jgi:hypothetical protein